MPGRVRFLSNPWISALLAGTAALGVNQFGLPVFGGTELLFGGWLVLLVVYTFGPGPGALAAALSLASTPFAWGHPWALTVAVLEALCVGWFIHRRRWPRWSATLAYWALIGLPVATIGLMRFTDIAFPSNVAIVCKYFANAVLMAIVAIPLSQSRRYRVWLGLPVDDSPPLEQVLLQRFATIVVLTIATLAIFVGRKFDRTLRRETEDVLQRYAREAAHDLGLRVQEHLRPLQMLADDAARAREGEEYSSRLELIRASYPGFLTLLGTDSAGRIIATAPRLDPEGRPLAILNLSVADRDYFQVAMRTGRPFVSDVFRGRGFGTDLIVALSVPVFGADGRPHSIVEGSLNLGNLLGHIAGNLQSDHRSVLVIDTSRQVVVSTGAFAQEPLRRIGKGTLPAVTGDSTQRPVTISGLPGAPGEAYLVSGALVPGIGWQVYLAAPVWETQRTIAQFYLLTFVAAAAAVLVALGFARHTSREVTRPLGQMVGAIRALADRSVQAVAPPEEHVSAELAQLSQAAHAAARTLSQANAELASALDQRDRTHDELRQVLLHLDEKVRQRTEQLAIALKQAESASRAKSEFIASTSHELRTPLNGVLGLSEILLDQALGPLNPEQIRTLRMIEESGRHLLALINDILDLAKIEAGKFELEVTELALADLCQGALRLVQAAAEKKRQNLRLDLRTDVPTVQADPRRLKQVLVNLLGNAVKFTPEGGSITLEVEANEAEVRFTVADSGIGIAEADLQRLFVEFQQLDGTLTRRHEGTGLGLVLVKRLMALHGGHVTVESQVGVGSRFTVHLPRRSAGTAAVVAAPVIAAPVSPGALPAGTRVLIAEDNDINHRVFVHLPLFRDCVLLRARNGREAVELTANQAPALILMDVQMPEMDGLEATRLIRALPGGARIPIIMITAAAMVEDRARCLAAGANAYLPKPVDLRALAHEVREALQSLNR